MPKTSISPRQAFTGRNRARRHYRAKWIAGARRASQGTLVVDPGALLLRFNHGKTQMTVVSDGILPLGESSDASSARPRKRSARC
jgi:hypothetical protein